jgi:hypothetical protein
MLSTQKQSILLSSIYTACKLPYGMDIGFELGLIFAGITYFFLRGLTSLPFFGECHYHPYTSPSFHSLQNQDL